LCVMPINIPPLRERGGDIQLLAEHFLQQFSEDAFRGNITLSERTISIFDKHPWLGNCRELQNVIQFALVQCQGNLIEPEHLPANLFAAGPENFIQPRREPKLNDKNVLEALQKAGGNKRRAAEILGVSRSTLYRFFERHRQQS
jgi:DNA-binding NtrC family response regulator